MGKKNTPTTRVDPKFYEKGREIMKERAMKGLASFNPRELSMAEYTKLIMRTNSWKGVEAELKSKPKRENMKNTW